MHCTQRVRIIRSLVVVAAFISPAGCAKDSKGSTDAGGSNTPPQKARIKENFEKVKVGMGIAEVVNLLGPPIQESPDLERVPQQQGMKGWEEDANVYVVFYVNDKVTAKQSAPKPQVKSSEPKDQNKPPTPSKVTKENYEKITLGMSRKEVESILGHGGRVVNSTTVTGVKGTKMIWQDGKKHIQVLFENDKMIASSPFGL